MLVLLVCSFSLVRLSREGVNRGFRGGGESEVSSLWKGRNVGYLFCLGLGRGYIEYNHIREAERWKRSELSHFHGLIEHN